MTENSSPIQYDNVIEGVQRTVKLLNYMLLERGQLYGTVIYLMQVLEKNRIVMPPLEAMKEYHDSFYVTFDQDGEEFFLNIKSREDDDGEESS